MSSSDFRTEAGKVQLAQRLAHVEKEVRDEATGEVEDMLRGDTTMTRLDYLKLWKALYYTVWLADKVPIQQEVIGRIAQMQHLLTSSERREWFVDCFFETIMREWMHIDKWRVDKFLSFIRKMVRHQLAGIARGGWEREDVQRYLHLMEHRVMPSPPSGVRMQVMSVLIEEACLVAGPTLTSAQIRLLLRPVYKLLLTERSSVAVVRKACSVIKSAAERQIRLLQQHVADLTERAQAEEGSPKENKAEAAAPAVDSPLAPLLALDLSALALDVFELAGEEETWDTAREALYECHEAVMECAAESDDLQMELVVLGGDDEEAEEAEEKKEKKEQEEEDDDDDEEKDDDEEDEEPTGEDVPVGGFAVGAASLLQEIKARRERRREERERKRDDRKRGRAAGKKRSRSAAAGAAGKAEAVEEKGGKPKQTKTQQGKKPKEGGKKDERKAQAAGGKAAPDAGVAKPQRSKKRSVAEERTSNRSAVAENLRGNKMYRNPIAGVAEEERPLRLLLVTSNLDGEVDGVSLTMQRLAGWLANNNCEVMVMTADNTMPPVPTILSPCVRRKGFGVKMGFGRQWEHDNVRVVRVAQPWYRDVLIGLSEAHPAAGIPTADDMNQAARFRPDVVHVTDPSDMSRCVLDWARRVGVPAVMTFHTDYPRLTCLEFPIPVWAQDLLYKTLWTVLTTGWLNRSGVRRIMPPCSEWVRRLRAKGVADWVDLSVFPRGADFDVFNPEARSAAFRAAVARRAGIPDPSKLRIVTSVSGIMRQKRPLLVAETLARLVDEDPNTVGIFVGKGVLLPELYRYLENRTASGHAVGAGRPMRSPSRTGAAELFGDNAGAEALDADTEAERRVELANEPYPRLLLPGTLPFGPQLALWMASADVFLFTSRAETFGRVTVEFMACGVPCVCASGPGTRDIIKNEETGVLVAEEGLPEEADALILPATPPPIRAGDPLLPEGDPAPFVAACRRLLQDDEMRARLGVAGLERARSVYSWDVILQEMRDVYLGTAREAAAERAGVVPPAE